MKPERHVWDEGSTHRAVAGKDYDEVWDYAEQLEADVKALREELNKWTQREVDALLTGEGTMELSERIMFWPGPLSNRRKLSNEVAQLEDMLAIYKVLRNAHKSYRRALAHEVSAIRQLLDGGTALALETIEDQEGEIIKFKTELADYKKHFEPQMIQFRLLAQAEGEQSKTYTTHEEQRRENVNLRK